ncbi:MAG: low molecular weight protein-tyrosine-phosphatase, partial [Sphingorhabdus sp.]
MKPSNSQRSLKVLFVCLGNICRSPLAEAALRDIAARRKLSIMVDSAGTGNWHEGNAPDSRACDVAMRLGGLDISMLRARQLSIKDFDRFDHIIAMDDSTLAHVLAMMPIGSAAQT